MNIARQPRANAGVRVGAVKARERGDQALAAGRRDQFARR